MKNYNPLHYILDIITVLMIIIDRSAYIVDKLRSIFSGKDDKNGGNK